MGSDGAASAKRRTRQGACRRPAEISGILHVLKGGYCRKDCPPEYGPCTTTYNRFVRWARRGVWENLFGELRGVVARPRSK
ncbi:MAG: hypothetical protein B7Y08_29785 [Rhodospirillales bacterium 24-66-33]|nr:MAG: hypothetical protein B7Y57_29800 [Rhodospirillales bacterium 35-66-84]OYZ90465.1 MAG: hypothetical protein B7Y08_29785 [Rhodospirillales bacterium 24-66-33]OZB20799.1 MAG: hypothetical protein B7X63_29855 [Rhodospirillales bacterium 39-66-50]